MRIIISMALLSLASMAYGACIPNDNVECPKERPNRNPTIHIDLGTILSVIEAIDAQRPKTESTKPTPVKPKTTVQPPPKVNPKPVTPTKPKPVIKKPIKPKTTIPPKLIKVNAPEPRPIEEVIPALKWDFKNRLEQKSDYLIKDEYIVTLKDDMGLDPHEISAKLGIEHSCIGKIFSKLFSGFMIHTTADEALKLATHPLVKSVTQDMMLTSFENKAPAGIPKRVDMNPSRSGETHDINVYVIDTGIREDHIEVKDKIFRWRGIGSDLGGTAENECNNHGTAMASLIAGESLGQAMRVRLTDVTIATCPNRFLKTQPMVMSASNMLAALEWIAGEELLRADEANWQPAVVNMSFGAPASWLQDLTQPNLIRDGVFELALRKFIEDTGAIVVAAAGNDGSDACQIFPAHMPEVITVGALDKDGYIAPFSNYGPCVNSYARGEQQIAADASDKNTKEEIEGTSGSAAIVSGIIAHRLAAGEDASQILNDINQYPLSPQDELKHIEALKENLSNPM